jgi:hypothetical protein
MLFFSFVLNFSLFCKQMIDSHKIASEQCARFLQAALELGLQTTMSVIINNG